jgi:hypothetical protein
MHGYGRFEWANGDVYSGDFIEVILCTSSSFSAILSRGKLKAKGLKSMQMDENLVDVFVILWRMDGLKK